MSSDTGLCCAACGNPLGEQDRFCEQCGARLGDVSAAERGCHACGAPREALDEGGYCSICGVRERPAEQRVELDLTIAAVVSDQGRVHRRNEDAFHLEVYGQSSGAAVICDGISSASSGDVAAQEAAKAAGERLSRAGSDRSLGAGEAMLQAIGAAHAAVAQVPWTTRVDRAMPSCTVVCALWREDEIAVGWLGDSRAYWIDPNGARQLTIDDSWAEQQISEGLLSAQEAFRDPRSHSITHWVGADAPARPPRVTVLHPETPGRLLLCTDGLWNYAPSVGELAGLIEALPHGAAPAAVARALTETALARGGRDNITVAVVDVGAVLEEPS